MYPLGEYTGGHGIEVLNMYDSGLSLCAYTGNSLISNNILLNNGGAAVFVSESNSVNIYHNTIAFNSAHNQMWSPEIYLSEVYNVFVLNNILYAPNSLFVIMSTNTISCWGNYNLYDEAWTNNLNGIHDVHTSSPGCNILSDNFQIADFSLISGSLAIDAALCDSLVFYDIENTPRPLGLNCDIGAFEFNPHAFVGQIQKPEIQTIQTNQGVYLLAEANIVQVHVFDITGRIVYSSHENSNSVFIPLEQNK